MRFVFELTNDWTNQTFSCDAEDMVGALMIATDFIGKLNEAISKLDGGDEISPIRLHAIAEEEHLPADRDGMESFLESIRVQYGV